ncbi:hypothetical protein [Frankia sp. Cr2]|uniref:hypothetical protein n=1 Tax=Frankia sp. Cr2 TaxID=3073932 RepID=UPI002AD4E796|nr:hypothetical protein [Frankia sp. Cr2]
MLRGLQVEAPIRRRLRAAPLVVLNACGSVASSPLSYDGFGHYVLAKGRARRHRGGHRHMIDEDDRR